MSEVNKDTRIISPATEIKSPSHNSLLADDVTKVQVVKITDLTQTKEAETGYGDTNAWVERIKYSVCTLNKSKYYACTAG
jgi:hypothetical protein